MEAKNLVVVLMSGGPSSERAALAALAQGHPIHIVHVTADGREDDTGRVMAFGAAHGAGPQIVAGTIWDRMLADLATAGTIRAFHLAPFVGMAATVAEQHGAVEVWTGITNKIAADRLQRGLIHSEHKRIILQCPLLERR